MRKKQIMFSHKAEIDRKGTIGFTDTNRHPYTTSLYPNKTKEIYAVLVRKARTKKKTPYYGTLEDDGLFDFIYPSRCQTVMCFPGIITYKLHNLVLTEIGMISAKEVMDEDYLRKTKWEKVFDI